MAQLIEPRLPAGALVFIHHFPAAQAMLALLDPLDPRLAMRFELYCDGFELANGWEELVDSRENRARFDEQNGSRRAAGLAEVPLDKRFLGALEKGIPPCAGVALGVDRLVMLALGTRQMGEVRAFPWDES